MTISQPGDVWQIGPHRLAVGSATDQATVNALFNGAQPDLVVTSPPYAKQRAYDRPMADWDSLMRGVFSAIPAHDHTQVMVNVGVIYRHSEVDLFWWEWCQWFRSTGWRFFSWNVWHKISPPPQASARFTTSHEWLLHFNRNPRTPNKIIPKQPQSITANMKPSRGTIMKRDGTRPAKHSSPQSYANTHKCPQSVLCIHGEKHGATNHPAPFPVKLPQTLIEAYTDPQQIVYDPFAGSGTSIVAADRSNRIGYGIELSPSYADEALHRLHNETGITPRNQAGQSLDPFFP